MGTRSKQVSRIIVTSLTACSIGLLHQMCVLIYVIYLHKLKYRMLQKKSCYDTNFSNSSHNRIGIQMSRLPLKVVVRITLKSPCSLHVQKHYIAFSSVSTDSSLKNLSQGRFKKHVSELQMLSSFTDQLKKDEGLNFTSFIS